MIVFKKQVIISFSTFCFAVLLNGLVLYFFACQYLFHMQSTVKIFTGLFFLILYLICFAGFSLLYGKKIRFSIVDLFFFGYASLIVASLLFGINDGNSDYVKQQLVFFALYGIIGYSVGRVFPRQQLLKLVSALLLVGALEIAASFFILYEQGWRVAWQFHFDLANNPILMAITYLRIILAGSVYLAYVQLKGEKINPFTKLAVYFIVVSSLFFLLLTGCRQIIIGLFLSLAFAFMYFGISSIKKFKLAALILVVILTVVGFSWSNFQALFYATRFF